MGGCLSACLPLLRTLFPRNSLLPPAPHSCPPAPADSPLPAAALAQQYSPFTRSADEEQHQATFSETQLDRFLQEITKGEDFLPELGVDQSFYTSKLGTENSHGELRGNETELKPYLLQPKIDVKEDPYGNQSPQHDDDEFRSWRKPDVSDPTSPLDSELFAHEYNLPSRPDPPPGFPIPQHAAVISAYADSVSTNQPWKQGHEVSDDLPSLDYYVPVSNLPYESYPCPLEWREPPPPPSIPHPPSQLPPQEIPTDGASFRSREIRPPVGLSHRSERKKAIAAYGDTKSSSTASK